MYLKKYIIRYCLPLFLFSLTIINCRHNGLANISIKPTLASNNFIDSTNKQDGRYIRVINPYKKKLDSIMNHPISYTEVELSKEGLSGNLSNLVADLMFIHGKQYAVEHKMASPDFVLLNYGGLRTVIPKGLVTVKNIFEVTPFENELVMVNLSGSTIKTMIDFLITGRKGHPLSNIVITSHKGETKCSISNIDFDISRTYWVLTNDYLVSGGDSMFFFENNIQKIPLNEKIRDVLILEMSKLKTLPNIQEKRLIIE